MVIFLSHISIFLLVLSSLATFHLSVSSSHKVVHCNENDLRILSIFKQGIIDPFNLLSTWSNVEDCCAWEGVECHNTTGRVTELDLYELSEYPYKTLKGEINLSLLQLEFLSYLDLSWHEFDVISIPPIHHNVTIASNLYHLDLSLNDNPRMDNLQWLSRFSSIKYLDLSSIDLHKENNWLQLMTMLPSLSELHLSYCNLNNISPSLMYVNFTSLVTLDLSDSNFNSMLPYWLFNLSSDMSYINLGGNNFYGEIPSSSLNLRNLRFLDLSENKLNGSIPDWIGQQQNLQKLFLSKNQLKGSIPNWIGHQEHLQHLYLSDNLFFGSFPSFLGNITSLIYLSMGSTFLSGAISEIHFSKLKHLELLDLRNSTFAFHFDVEWIPPFQLGTLVLANTNQGPSFPPWIYTQKSLQFLDISSSGISLIDEDEFWHFVAGIGSLYLSNNSISGDISNVLLNSSEIMLDRNNFTGGIPHISPEATNVDLSYNFFSGPIPTDLSNLTQLLVLNLEKNKFSGTLPVEMPSSLEVMILRSNQLEGNIPPQIFNLSDLFLLDLSHNKLSGSIPHCVYNLTQMITEKINLAPGPTIGFTTKGQYYEILMHPERRTIDLSANNLSGEIPLQLFRLIQVQTLNLSHNHFNGTVDKTIGSMKNLESLDFSNNNLSGEIPQSMAGLSFLGYLNLSYNKFIGKIPIGTQLQGFNASSYIGNAELCGAPLTKCITNEENPEKEKQHAENGEDDLLRKSLYLGMGVGFAVGFWGICGSLFLVRKWRHSYFQFLDQKADQLYVTFTVMINNLRRSAATTS